jgi:hypothetical protein
VLSPHLATSRALRLTLRCTRLATAGFGRFRERVNSNVEKFHMERLCPRCGSPSSVAGRLELSGTDSGWPTYFLPDGLRFFTARKAVSLVNGQQFLACLKCGLAWNELDPKELLDLLEAKGTTETKATIADAKEVLP